MKEITKLLEIMQRLRDAQTGCPWDLQQDYKSIVPHTLEEAYEVADAIEKQDFTGLQDELGDLLFQVVFLSQLAAEEGRFDFGDVARGIGDKLYRRHPHVFASDAEALSDADAVKGQWEQIKAAERATGQSKPVSQVADIPVALPAIQRAFKLGQRTGRVGFDWPDPGPVREQIDAELAELAAELDATDNDPARVAEECGDVLFSVVQLCRHLGVQPEIALRDCNQRFSDRFQAMEAELETLGRAPETVSAAEWDSLWQRAKAHS